MTCSRSDSADNNNKNNTSKSNDDDDDEAMEIIGGGGGGGTMTACPSCGHPIMFDNHHRQRVVGIQQMQPGLPAGVKFDPTDQEILEHLEAKVRLEAHPLIDEFIHTLDGEDGICCTHPVKLPGVTKDGLVRHFFHRPSKAYTTGTRKRRKVQTEADGSETRWHKTGKTRPVLVKGRMKGYKKILVLYTNYGKQRKPEKTNWVMHQYHLGDDEDEKEGELVASKIFYQTQPRQCSGSISKDSLLPLGMANEGHEAAGRNGSNFREATVMESFNPTLISFGQYNHDHTTARLLPSFNIHDTPFIP